MNPVKIPSRLFKKMRVVPLREDLMLLTKDTNQSLVLTQMLYWTERIDDLNELILEENKRLAEHNQQQKDYLRGWIWKSARQMSEELFHSLSEDTVQRAFNGLLKRGILTKRRNPKFKYDRTIQYRVDLLVLRRLMKEIGIQFTDFQLDDLPQNAECIPQNAEWKTQNAEWKTQNAESIPQGAEAIPEITVEITSDNTHNHSQPKQLPPPTRENPESEKSAPPNKKNDTAVLEEFLTFWQAYPRKVSKHNARRAWEKHRPNLDEVLPALERAKQEWNDPKYIPHPATWINGRRWEDEVKEEQSESSPLDGREEEFWSWLQATRPWEKRRHTSMIPQKFIDEFLEGGNQRDEKPFVFNNLKQEIDAEEDVENF
jgi:hypothetical protein